MSPGDRCDQLVHLIDEALDDREWETAPAPIRPLPVAGVERDGLPEIEELPGHWGVYYLRPA